MSRNEITRLVAIDGAPVSDVRIAELSAALDLQTPPRSLRRAPAVIEFDVAETPGAEPAEACGWQLAWLPKPPADFSSVLLVFDMDSTLIEQEVIDELARAHGVYEQIRRITERAMQGELDFRESLRERVGLLEGLPIAQLATVRNAISSSPGAETLFATLNVLGARTAIISGGFQFVGQSLKTKLGIDDCFAHELEGRAGRLTGRVASPVIDADGKAERLTTLSRRHGATYVVAVGDGANDLAMMGRADIGIAYRAKPIVAAAAEARITHLGLDAVLHFLGVPQSEFAGDP